MKFYKINYISYFNKKNSAIFNTLNIQSIPCVRFIKNGKHHNPKNASFILYNKSKSFYLNSKYYGYENKFNKQSWRRFVKLQAFL